MKKDKWILKCSQCKKDVKITQHINKCECGARIKILDYKIENYEKEKVVFNGEDLNEIIDCLGKWIGKSHIL